jgi:predicted XRE-type DNA-binding protein
MPHQNNTPTGELLQTLLALKKIKQAVAAKTLGVRQQSISKLVKCQRISPKKFELIVAALKFSAEEIEMARNFLPPPPPMMRYNVLRCYSAHLCF